MLFKNLKSGNIVSATDESAIELMRRSPIYESYIPEPVKPAVKSRKPKAETETSGDEGGETPPLCRKDGESA